jgi:hypothetical protein
MPISVRRQTRTHTYSTRPDFSTDECRKVDRVVRSFAEDSVYLAMAVRAFQSEGHSSPSTLTSTLQLSDCNDGSASIIVWNSVSRARDAAKFTNRVRCAARMAHRVFAYTHNSTTPAVCSKSHPCLFEQRHPRSVVIGWLTFSMANIHRKWRHILCRVAACRKTESSAACQIPATRRQPGPV